MDRLAHQSVTDETTGQRQCLAPRPRTVAETGLGELFLAELVAKHLHDGGGLTLRQLAQRLALAGTILEELLAFLRREARVEILGGAGGDRAGLRYVLTDRGRAFALDALARAGYLGPAPVPVQDYTRVAQAQSVHRTVISRGAMHEAFSDTVIAAALLDQLGPALHSGRAIFVYGPAGSGKTYVTQRLARLLADSVLVPHAIAVNETVVELFDPVLHHAIEPSSSASGLMLEEGEDPRYVRCRRPVVITGGELSVDMLEVHGDRATRQYHAPLQLKANNGLFIVDDLGRQRVAARELLNRWIVPMEEGKDYHHLGAGRHFSVPFDVVLVFSTNLDPCELADEAFLRRIGHKIRFDYLDEADYLRIWQQVCEQHGLECDRTVVRFVLDELYRREGAPLLPCHPRDLLGLAFDRCRYLGEDNTVTAQHLRWAWDSYFVKLHVPLQPNGATP